MSVKMEALYALSVTNRPSSLHYNRKKQGVKASYRECEEDIDVFLAISERNSRPMFGEPSPAVEMGLNTN